MIAILLYHSEFRYKVPNQVQLANDDNELHVVWVRLHDFTAPNDTYFGHEIDSVLELVTQLLDRQDEQMVNTTNRLQFQINTTYTGVGIFDNLVSHDIQWDQLGQVRIYIFEVNRIGCKIVGYYRRIARKLRCSCWTSRKTWLFD